MFLTKTYDVEDYSQKWILSSTTQLYRPSQRYGSTNITDGVLNGGNCQLSESFTNNGAWKLKMDIKIDVGGGGIGIRTAQESTRSYNWFKMNGGGGVGYSDTNSHAWNQKEVLSDFKYGEWQTLIIENDNGNLSISIGNSKISNNQWNGRNNSIFYIGIDQWVNTTPSTPHYIKNIRLLYL